MDLTNTTAMVTGTSRGIGRALAKRYVELGATVIGCATTESDLESLEAECSTFTGDFLYVVGDLSDARMRSDLINTALEETGRIDLLVNNAGILGPRARIDEFPDEEWDRVITVNLNAVFHLTKHVLQQMRKQGSGRIINVTSGVGTHGRATWGAYSVSKFGIEGLTQIIADEVEGSGVEVNAVNPGRTRTDMRAAAAPEEDPMTIPAPEDILDVFVHLASPEGKGTNGKRFEAQDFSTTFKSR